MHILNDIILTLITNVEGGLGSQLRYWYYRPRLKKEPLSPQDMKSQYFRSMAGFRVYAPENVSIGGGCSFNHGVIIDAEEGNKGSITIGNNVLIGQYSVIRNANHKYANPDVPIKEQGHDIGNIIIQDGAWLGTHVVVLKDVNIGRHSAVAAHSLANKNVPDFEVWGGVPAKFLWRLKR